MTFDGILDILVILLPIIGIGAVFFLYYKRDKARPALRTVLRFAPFVMSLLASKIKDKKGVFDSHDLVVLLGRVAEHVRETIDNPANTSFDAVQDDLFDFVRRELDAYREGGIKGVPHVTDESIRVQIRVIFEAAQRMTSENSTGDDISG